MWLYQMCLVYSVVIILPSSLINNIFAASVVSPPVSSTSAGVSSASTDFAGLLDEEARESDPVDVIPPVDITVVKEEVRVDHSYSSRRPPSTSMRHHASRPSNCPGSQHSGSTHRVAASGGLYELITEMVREQKDLKNVVETYLEDIASSLRSIASSLQGQQH